MTTTPTPNSNDPIILMSVEERRYFIQDAYESVAKISASLAAGEKCPKSDKRALYEIACKALASLYGLQDDARLIDKAARNTPPGWVIVPREPTDAMAVAAIKASLRNPAINGVAIYRAMLEAAPLPPKPPESLQ